MLLFNGWDGVKVMFRGAAAGFSRSVARIPRSPCVFPAVKAPAYIFRSKNAREVFVRMYMNQPEDVCDILRSGSQEEVQMPLKDDEIAISKNEGQINAIRGLVDSGKINEAHNLLSHVQSTGSILFCEKYIRLSNDVLQNLFVRGETGTALSFFEKLKSRNQTDTVTWNTAIDRIKSDSPTKALHLWDQMISSSIKPDGITALAALSAAASLEKKNVQGVIKDILSQNILQTTTLRNRILHAYFRCQDTTAALSMFEEMVSSNQADNFTWTTAISGLSKAKKPALALVLWDRMLSSGTKPDLNTVVAVLSAVASLKDPKVAHAVCREISKQNIPQNDIRLGSQILCTLFECGDIDTALPFFEKLKSNNQVDTVTWTNAIDGLSKAKQPTKAIALWNQMLSSGTKPDLNTVGAVLSAASSLKDSKVAHAVCREISKQNIPQNDIRLGSQILCTLFECGDIDTALLFFEKLKSNNQVNTVTWTNAIDGLSKAKQPAKAIALWNQMLSSGNNPDLNTVRAVLSAAASLKDSKVAHAVCREISKQNIPQNDIRLGSQILCTLFECGDIDTALPFFEKLKSNNQVDTVTWTNAIDGLSKAKQPAKAIALWNQMLSSGTKPDASTISAVLSAASFLKDSKVAHAVCREISKHNIPLDIQSNSKILCTFFKCGDIDTALLFFEKLKSNNQVDTVTWTNAIDGLSKAKQPIKAIALWNQMLSSSTKPNAVTVGAVLSAAASLKDPKVAHAVWEEISKHNIPLTIQSSSRMLYTLFECGDIDTALGFFEKLKSNNQVNTVTWTNAIDGLSKAKQPARAIALWNQMLSSGTKPNAGTFSAALSAASSLKDSKVAHAVCREISKHNIPLDIQSNSKILCTLFECGDIDTALPFFEKLKSNNQVDTVTWTNAIDGLSKAKQPARAIALWNQMLSSSTKPDLNTVVAALSAAASLKDSEVAHAACREISKHNIPLDIQSSSQILCTLFECGDIDTALGFFEKLKSNNQVDTVTWTNAIDGLSKAKQPARAIALWDQMLSSGIKFDLNTIDAVLSAAASLKDSKVAHAVCREISKHNIPLDIQSSSQILCTLFECGDIDTALPFFEKLKSNNQVDTVTWTIAIDGLSKAKQPTKTIALWNQMLSSGNNPDLNTVGAVLSAAASLKDPKVAHAVWEEISKHNIPLDIESSSRMLYTLFECGDIDTALGFFEKLKSNNQVDTVTWTNAIDGLSKAKQPTKAIALWNQMLSSSTKPDASTISAVLSAAASLKDSKVAHAVCEGISKLNIQHNKTLKNQLLNTHFECQNISEAFSLLEELKASGQMNTIAWNIAINGLGKAGEAKKAIELFNEMVRAKHPIDERTILAVLNVCKMAEDTTLAMEIFDTMESKFSIKPDQFHLSSLLATLKFGGNSMRSKIEKYKQENSTANTMDDV